MATFSPFSHFLLVSFAAFLLQSESSLSKVPQSGGAAGVFLLIEGGKYTFNFSAGRDACFYLNLSIASRDQMERALQRGLETCKFGWIAEQIAVIPRLTADKNCGKSKTGVVTWAAGLQQKFGVYCFNASDLEESSSTASPQSSTLTAATQTSTAAATSIRSTTFPPSKTTKTPERTSFTSAFNLLIRTTRSTRISTSTSPTQKSFSTYIPTSPSHFPTSKSVASFTVSPSPHTSSFSVSSESEAPRPTGSTKPPLGDVPTALIILSVILLLLTAAGVVWYYKLNIFTFCLVAQQKDETETEMWKQADSETELQDGEEEEPDRKYSSDITLCVNPDIKTN
ncbi:lymphatic vessel endothelial hyaluronic receptor 1b [Centropristis striata]|uniref:lymphatic vessel endothelial hyaluronic receptor 1b n=1 Tax=Centropristis striata TaxID=184440 RepID=UPI0027E095AF|nr:lymphatic vessel endothelial hyaluronic receptor 1b [Centropristis striata]